MGWCKFAPLLLVVLITISAIFGPQFTESGPILGAPGSCSKTCSQKNDIVNFAAGKAFTYEFSLKTMTSSDDDQSGDEIELTGVAKISVISPCEMTAQLMDVAVKGSSDDTKIKQELELQHTPFAYDNGRLLAICPSFQETKLSRNIKSAILSALQISLSNLNQRQLIIETDVSGECLAEYTPESSSDGYKITKIKHVDGCAKRYDHFHAAFSSSIKVPTQVPKIGAIRSTLKCDIQHGGDKVPKQTQCEETIKQRKLSVVSRVNLKKKSVEDSVSHLRMPASMMTKQSPILDHSIEKSSWSLDPSVPAKMIEEMQNSPVSDRIKMFAQLVALLRPVHDFSAIGSQIWPKDNYQKVTFLDALAATETDAAARYLMSPEVVSQAKTDPSYLINLYNVPKPSKETIEVARNYLDSEVGAQSELAVAALVGKFCQLEKDCPENEHVRAIAVKIAGKIAASCATNAGNLQITVQSIHALGNMGRGLTESEVAKLFECQKTRDEIQVPIYATNALRFVPCHLMQNMRLDNLESTVDPRIKISLFLARTKCMDSQELSMVIDDFEKEVTSQFVQFAVSYLSRVATDGNPENPNLRNLLVSDKDGQNMEKITDIIMRTSSQIAFSSTHRRFKLPYDSRSVVADVDAVFHGPSPLPSLLRLKVGIADVEELLEPLELGLIDVGNSELEKFFGVSRPLKNKQEAKFNYNKYDQKLKNSLESVLAKQRPSLYLGQQGYTLYVRSEISTKEAFDVVKKRIERMNGKTFTLFSHHIHIPAITGLQLGRINSLRLYSKSKDGIKAGFSLDEELRVKSDSGGMGRMIQHMMAADLPFKVEISDDRNTIKLLPYAGNFIVFELKKQITSQKGLVFKTVDESTIYQYKLQKFDGLLIEKDLIHDPELKPSLRKLMLKMSTIEEPKDLIAFSYEINRTPEDPKRFIKLSMFLPYSKKNIKFEFGVDRNSNEVNGELLVEDFTMTIRGKMEYDAALKKHSGDLTWTTNRDDSGTLNLSCDFKTELYLLLERKSGGPARTAHVFLKKLDGSPEPRFQTSTKYSADFALTWGDFETKHEFSASYSSSAETHEVKGDFSSHFKTPSISKSFKSQLKWERGDMFYSKMQPLEGKGLKFDLTSAIAAGDSVSLENPGLSLGFIFFHNLRINKAEKQGFDVNVYLRQPDNEKSSFDIGAQMFLSDKEATGDARFHVGALENYKLNTNCILDYRLPKKVKILIPYNLNIYCNLERKNNWKGKLIMNQTNNQGELSLKSLLSDEAGAELHKITMTGRISGPQFVDFTMESKWTPKIRQFLQFNKTGEDKRTSYEVTGNCWVDDVKKYSLSGVKNSKGPEASFVQAIITTGEEAKPLFNFTNMEDSQLRAERRVFFDITILGNRYLFDHDYSFKHLNWVRFKQVWQDKTFEAGIFQNPDRYLYNGYLRWKSDYWTLDIEKNVALVHNVYWREVESSTAFKYGMRDRDPSELNIKLNFKYDEGKQFSIDLSADKKVEARKGCGKAFLKADNTIFIAPTKKGWKTVAEYELSSCRKGELAISGELDLEMGWLKFDYFLPGLLNLEKIDFVAKAPIKEMWRERIDVYVTTSSVDQRGVSTIQGSFKDLSRESKFDHEYILELTTNNIHSKSTPVNGKITLQLNTFKPETKGGNLLMSYDGGKLDVFFNAHARNDFALDYGYEFDTGNQVNMKFAGHLRGGNGEFKCNQHFEGYSYGLPEKIIVDLIGSVTLEAEKARLNSHLTAQLPHMGAKALYLEVDGLLDRSAASGVVAKLVADMGKTEQTAQKIVNMEFGLSAEQGMARVIIESDLVFGHPDLQLRVNWKQPDARFKANGWAQVYNNRIELTDMTIMSDSANFLVASNFPSTGKQQFQQLFNFSMDPVNAKVLFSSVTNRGSNLEKNLGKVLIQFELNGESKIDIDYKLDPQKTFIFKLGSPMQYSAITKNKWEFSVFFEMLPVFPKISYTGRYHFQKDNLEILADVSSDAARFKLFKALFKADLKGDSFTGNLFFNFDLLDHKLDNPIDAQISGNINNRVAAGKASIPNVGNYDFVFDQKDSSMKFLATSNDGTYKEILAEVTTDSSISCLFKMDDMHKFTFILDGLGSLAKNPKMFNLKAESELRLQSTDMFKAKMKVDFDPLKEVLIEKEVEYYSGGKSESELKLLYRPITGESKSFKFMITRESNDVRNFHLEANGTSTIDFMVAVEVPVLDSLTARFDSRLKDVNNMKFGGFVKFPETLGLMNFNAWVRNLRGDRAEVILLIGDQGFNMTHNWNEESITNCHWKLYESEKNIKTNIGYMYDSNSRGFRNPNDKQLFFTVQDLIDVSGMYIFNKATGHTVNFIAKPHNVIGYFVLQYEDAVELKFDLSKQADDMFPNINGLVLFDQAKRKSAIKFRATPYVPQAALEFESSKEKGEIKITVTYDKHMAEASMSNENKYTMRIIETQPAWKELVEAVLQVHRNMGIELDYKSEHRKSSLALLLTGVEFCWDKDADRRVYLKTVGGGAVELRSLTRTVTVKFGNGFEIQSTSLNVPDYPPGERDMKFSVKNLAGNLIITSNYMKKDLLANQDYNLLLGEEKIGGFEFRRDAVLLTIGTKSLGYQMLNSELGMTTYPSETVWRLKFDDKSTNLTSDKGFLLNINKMNGKFNSLNYKMAHADGQVCEGDLSFAKSPLSFKLFTKFGSAQTEVYLGPESGSVYTLWLSQQYREGPKEVMLKVLYGLLQDRLSDSRDLEILTLLYQRKQNILANALTSIFQEDQLYDLLFKSDTGLLAPLSQETERVLGLLNQNMDFEKIEKFVRTCAADMDLVNGQLIKWQQEDQFYLKTISSLNRYIIKEHNFLHKHGSFLEPIRNPYYSWSKLREEVKNFMNRSVNRVKKIILDVASDFNIRLFKMVERIADYQKRVFAYVDKEILQKIAMTLDKMSDWLTNSPLCATCLEGNTPFKQYWKEYSSNSRQAMGEIPGLQAVRDYLKTVSEHKMENLKKLRKMYLQLTSGKDEEEGPVTFMNLYKKHFRPDRFYASGTSGKLTELLVEVYIPTFMRNMIMEINKGLIRADYTQGGNRINYMKNTMKIANGKLWRGSFDTAELTWDESGIMVIYSFDKIPNSHRTKNINTLLMRDFYGGMFGVGLHGTSDKQLLKMSFDGCPLVEIENFKKLFLNGQETEKWTFGEEGAGCSVIGTRTTRGVDVTFSTTRSQLSTPVLIRIKTDKDASKYEFSADLHWKGRVVGMLGSNNFWPGDDKAKLNDWDV